MHACTDQVAGDCVAQRRSMMDAHLGVPPDRSDLAESGVCTPSLLRPIRLPGRAATPVPDSAAEVGLDDAGEAAWASAAACHATCSSAARALGMQSALGARSGAGPAGTSPCQVPSGTAAFSAKPCAMEELIHLPGLRQR